MQDREIVVQDVPVIVWIAGLSFIAGGIYTFFTDFAPVFLAGVFIIIGGFLIIFVPIVTVKLERGAGVLRIEKLGLTGLRVEEINVNKIASVYTQRRISDGDGGISYTYRVVIALDDGSEIPLRNSSSSGRRGKEKQSEAIRQAIGVGGSDQSLKSIAQEMGEAFRLNQLDNQEARTGIPVGEQETNGVHWKLESFLFGGGESAAPIYRWSSTDFETPDYFIYLAQRVEGAGKQSGLMKLAGNFLVQQSLRIYGFDDYYTPGLDKASSLEDVDRRLREEFFIYTSNPSAARRVLNPWSVMPLISWADRYALEKGTQQFHQLVVLYSPLGVYVSVLNDLTQIQVDELVSLGVELIRSQGV